MQQYHNTSSATPFHHYFLFWFRSRRGTDGGKESVVSSVVEESRVQEESKESVTYLTIHIYFTEYEEARSLLQEDSMSLFQRLLQRQTVCCRSHYFHTSLQDKFVNSCHVVTYFALLFYSVTRVDSDLQSESELLKGSYLGSHGHFLILLTLRFCSCLLRTLTKLNI